MKTCSSYPNCPCECPEECAYEASLERLSHFMDENGFRGEEHDRWRCRLIAGRTVTGDTPIIPRRAFLTCAVIVLAALWLIWVTTPSECKVPVEQMSQFCKNLLYP